MVIFVTHRLIFETVRGHAQIIQLYYMKTNNLADVQKALTKYFVSFGIPKLIVTDHECTFQ